ncbi:hypothetical protein TNCT_307141 [Trichonephila clavata]|uniref:Uncharacterized protein n=1 Tax=Trichonephila clavata TaxID=2740835 RepID=A0A8X6GVL8_TRICU|nr:hypothetical protein TNCT_307141 [Trichonephila clavata]
MVSVAIARTDDGRAAGAFLRHVSLMPHQYRALQGPGHVPLLRKFLQQGGRQRRVPEKKRVRGSPQIAPTSRQRERPFERADRIFLEDLRRGFVSVDFLRLACWINFDEH